MGWFSKKQQSDKASAGLPTGQAGRPITSAKTVKVSDYLSLKSIVFFPDGPSKQQVFGGLIGSLSLPDPGEALKAILSREEAGTTVIVPGLALPHARIPGISRIAAAIGIYPEGVADPKAEGGPIRLFVLFLGPADNMREHLAFLAAVSALFQTEGLSDALLKLASPDGVIQTIRATEQSL